MPRSCDYVTLYLMDVAKEAEEDRQHLEDLISSKDPYKEIKRGDMTMGQKSGRDRGWKMSYFEDGGRSHRPASAGVSRCWRRAGNVLSPTASRRHSPPNAC